MAHALSSQPDSLRVTPQQIQTWVRRYYAADRLMRKGVCLLNAGRYRQAAQVFQEADGFGISPVTLPRYLAACLMGQGRPQEAASQWSKSTGDAFGSNLQVVRLALAEWQSGQSREAVSTLRAALSRDSECAELHFQLANMLAGLDQFEEAELRYTQALNIEPGHVDAQIGLGLCCGRRKAPTEALQHLLRAQAQRPSDPRIGRLAALAAQAAGESGIPQGVPARMPAESPDDGSDVEELSRVIESEPDFVDAFLSLPQDEMRVDVLVMLLATLRRALERQPEQAELHYHCGRVLARLGRSEDAVLENERAVDLNPRFVRALIELSKLYHETDRRESALVRLEEAIAAGARYADVYFLLGNLYRDEGAIDRAREAYLQALSINQSYQAAREALAVLPA